MNLVWTATARDRLLEIEAFIARDDPSTAILFTDALIETAERLREFPDLGQRLPELPQQAFRQLAHDTYLIIYDVVSDTVRIRTVLEGHRMVPVEDLE